MRQTPLAAHSPQKKIVLTMSGQHDSYWQQAQEKIARLGERGCH